MCVCVCNNFCFFCIYVTSCFILLIVLHKNVRVVGRYIYMNTQFYISESSRLSMQAGMVEKEGGKSTERVEDVYICVC